MVKKRYSCRRYIDKEVENSLIDQIIEAGRLAPSACNKQPWRFAVVKDKEKREKIVKEGFLFGINMEWALKAPVFIVIGEKKDFFTHKLAPVVSGIDYSLIDIGIVGEHIVLQATELGLQSCWIGWINSEVVRKIVDWPKMIKPVVIITVGYGKEEGKSKKRLSKEELVKYL
ncbi:MAG: nitroreductase family protein [archaeon]